MKVSFIMPAWKAKYIDAAICSILGQTSSEWELVIVDDCSPDRLDSFVNKYVDPRILYHRNAHNIGGEDLVAQWNHSILYATGDWIVLAADDDLYAPDFCAAVCNLATKYPEIDLIRSRAETIDAVGLHVWQDVDFEELSSPFKYLHDWLEGKVMTCIGNFAFKRQSLLAVGGFINFPCGFCSDVATPIMLSMKGVANTSDVLFKFRDSGAHLSSDSTRLLDKMEASMRFYEWLEKYEYPTPISRRDAELYVIKNKTYLHNKCIYDCFNHTIKYASLMNLPLYLKHCTVASLWEKALMVARWLKWKMVR